MSHPSNQGKICVRGWHVHEVASSPDRLRKPLIRKNGEFTEVGWEDAYAFLATRLSEIRDRHGPDALAFLASPRCSNEESYLLQKLARTIIGTNNVDHGTGVYCNNSLNVLLDMLGVAAATNPISDLEKSRAIIVDGVDLNRQLPTIGGWVLRAHLNGAQLIVIDSRRHRIAESADHFLQIRPGTEQMLYGAMAKVIIDRGLRNLRFIKDHCHRYDSFLSSVSGYDLLSAAAYCGVPANSIEAAAMAYAQASPAAVLYSTGVEARGTDSIQAIVNLALLTANLGVRGGGIYPLTEQNNLQGVCDMGMLPDRFPGYRSLTNQTFRDASTKRWSCDLPKKPGRNARSLLSNEQPEKLKALWLCRYDPVSTAFFGDAKKTLDELELVVAQHLFLTGTARHAHVVLPVSAFGEERVTFTSTDRRIQLAEKVIEPLAGPVPAWQQLAELGQAMGASWDYPSAEAVMQEIGEVVPFYGGVTYENLHREYGRQWPCTRDKPLGTSMLFEEGIPKEGFRFSPLPSSRRKHEIEEEFPFTLVFGHSLYYWHQNVLVKHSETLKREYRILLLDFPDGFVEINLEDAKKLGIRNGDRVRLRSQVGEASSAARLTHEVRAGSIYVPYFVREVEKQIQGGAVEGGHRVQVRLEKEEA